MTAANEAKLALSDVLRGICADRTDDITIGELVDSFGRRAYGALLFVFAMPNVLPLPPGSTTVLGAPLLLLSPQIALGARRPWLPQWIRRRAIKAETLRHVFDRLLPSLERIERWSKPRLHFLFGPIGDRLIGLVCAFLALVLILPIPLGNMLPAATIGAFGLALFQRDGVIALAGYLGAAVSVGLLVLSAGAVALALRKILVFVGV